MTESVENILPGPNMAAHVCNPSNLEGQGEWITWSQEFETSLANMVKPSLYQKYKNELGVVVHVYNPSYSAIRLVKVRFFIL